MKDKTRKIIFLIGVLSAIIGITLTVLNHSGMGILVPLIVLFGCIVLSLYNHVDKNLKQERGEIQSP